MRALVVLGLVASASTARGDGAVEEISAGGVQQSATSARSSWLADKVGGFWEPGDAWQIRLDVTALHDLASSQLWSFGDPGDMWIANLAVEFDPGEHWNVRVSAGYSPTSTTTTSTTVQLPQLVADAALRADTATTSAAVSVGYDTGPGDFETALALGGAVNYIDSLQRITSLAGRDGRMIDPAQLSDACSRRCSAEVEAALAATPVQLAQVVIDASVAETFAKDTDLGLAAAYYLYDTDPTAVGNFAVTAAGRAGGNLAVAPLRFTVTPDVIHRVGPVMALASLSYGEYVGDDGYDLTATVRLQVKPARWLKLWLKAIGSRDRGSVDTSSGSVALGGQVRW